jgi:UMF1 family MFS transporter
VFWGKVSDAIGVGKVFPAGFLLWTSFLLTLPLIPAHLVLLWGFLAGFSLSHLWTTSRVFILNRFPEGEASVRLSFLSLTERIASTTGLTVWAVLLLLTDGNYRLSAGLMALFPFGGLLLFIYMRRKRLI